MQQTGSNNASAEATPSSSDTNVAAVANLPALNLESKWYWQNEDK